MGIFLKYNQFRGSYNESASVMFPFSDHFQKNFSATYIKKFYGDILKFKICFHLVAIKQLTNKKYIYQIKQYW